MTSKSKRSFRLHVSEIDTFMPDFLKGLRGGEVIALNGPLGAGKTTFTQKLGKGLGIKKRITSPTYILLQHFTGHLKQSAKKIPITLYHLDLYHTNSFTEVEQLGLTEFWQEPNTITIIEWADKIATELPPQTIYITFT